ncbi:MAG: substrate-binding domain-containing protein [Gammaproteobacteria bacterium]|nr:substrate-binding domain-containing protein [Gammaproteobacteria bacterium]
MSTQHRPRATLKTIAEMTGLSLSTVSLSLRDGNKLKKSTNDRVALAAEQLGYVPNRAGVRLRTGRTNVLSLVLSADESSLDFTRSLIHGIGTELRNTRFHLNVVPEFDPNDPIASIKYVVENQTADGIILTHTSARDTRVQLLLDADFPFVSHGRTEFYSQHPFHDFPAENLIELSVARLLKKNRKKLLLVAIDNGTTYYSIAINSFNRSIAEAGAHGDVLNDTQVLATTQSVREFAHSLADASSPYDGIICNSELTALAIIGGLQDRNRTLGHDYDLICRQTSEILPLLHPTIDTIAEDLRNTGSELARLLLMRLEGATVTDLQTLHDPVIHWRSPD